MTEHEHQDDLTQGYRDASARDERRPGAHVREAVRAHAQMVLDGQRNAQASASVKASQTPAANQSRWKISAFATVAVVGLAGLLVLQFERGTPEERDIAFGQPRPEASPAAPASPTAPTAPTATTAPAAPATAAPSLPVPQAPAIARTPDAPTRPSAKAAQATDAATEAVTETSRQPLEKPAAKIVPLPQPPADAAPATAPAPARPSPPPAAEPEQAKARAPLTAQDNAALRDLGPGAEAASSRAVPGPAPVAAAAAAPAPAPAAPAAAAPSAAVAAAPPEAGSGVGMLQSPRQRAEAASPQAPAEAMLAAARRGQVAQLEALIRQGAPLNTADGNGRTPLMLAVINGHAAAVKKLLALGANPALVDRYGLNALQHARKLGFTQIAALIEAGS